MVTRSALLSFSNGIRPGMGSRAAGMDGPSRWPSITVAGWSLTPRIPIDGAFLPERDSRTIALSPDGRWAVTSSHGYSSVKVWDAHTGRLVHNFPESPRRIVGTFSPDGHWLSVGHAGRIWELFETGTWTSRMVLGDAAGAGVFSPDSATYAYETYYEAQGGAISLVDVATGRELARLNDPDGAAAAQMVFSPDGTQLIAALGAQPQIRIWDLRAVRRRLADLSLDWSPSPSWGSPAPIADPVMPPRPYRVDQGRMDEWARSSYLKRREQQVADAEAVLIQDPGTARGARVAGDVFQRPRLGADHRAGLPSQSGPGAPSGTPRPGAETGRPRLPQYPGAGSLPRWALPRGHCAIERSLATNQTESTSHDLFILSLCHARQADLAQSRSYFDRAVSRRNSHGAGSTREDQELKELGDEADAAIRASVPDLPADVFSPEPVGPPDR